MYDIFTERLQRIVLPATLFEGKLVRLDELGAKKGALRGLLRGMEGGVN